MEKIDVIQVLMQEALDTRQVVDYANTKDGWATDDPEQQTRIMEMWLRKINAFETAAAMLVAQ